MIVGACEECGGPVLSTEPRVSPHGPIDSAKFIQGGDFGVLLKQAGYEPDSAYGGGGTWKPPRLLHLRCAPEDVRRRVLA